MANFQAIDSGTTGTGIGFSRNHVTMTDATNGGLHNRVDYYQAVSSPSISGFVASLYPKTVTNIELFYKNGTEDIQISNSLLTASNNEGMIPGGLQVKSGSSSILNGNSSQTINFTTAFPNALIAVQLTPLNTNTIIQVAGGASVSSFAAQRNGTSGIASFYWTAIGR